MLKSMPYITHEKLHLVFSYKKKKKKWGRFGVIEGGKWQNFGSGFDDLG